MATTNILTVVLEVDLSVLIRLTQVTNAEDLSQYAPGC